MNWKDYLKSVLWGYLISLLIRLPYFVYYGLTHSNYSVSTPIASPLWLAYIAFIAGLLVSAWRASIYSRK
jgi:hypothetical protein